MTLRSQEGHVTPNLFPQSVAEPGKVNLDPESYEKAKLLHKWLSPQRMPKTTSDEESREALSLSAHCFVCLVDSINE